MCVVLRLTDYRSLSKEAASLSYDSGISYVKHFGNIVQYHRKANKMTLGSFGQLYLKDVVKKTECNCEGVNPIIKSLVSELYIPTSQGNYP